MKDKLPSAIGFDLDNTLYSYEKCNKNGIMAVKKFLIDKFEISDETFHKNFNIARANHKERVGNVAVSHSRIFYFIELLRILKINNNFKLVKKLDHIFWKEYFKHMELNISALKLLKKIKEQKILTYILTDMTLEIQHRKISSLDIEKFFDLILTSEEVGRDKPYLGGFHMASSILGFSIEQSWYIGDSKSKDIIPASSLGIKSFQIHENIENSFDELNKIFNDLEQ